GRNGTGKSTLLKIIAGLTALDDGELEHSVGLHIVLVEQEPQLPEAETVRDILILRGRLEGIPDERERWQRLARLDEYLQRLQVASERGPQTTSGGERKRAALALALALQPQLLLLDEPTNHLDIDGIAALEDMLVKGPASLIVTH